MSAPANVDQFVIFLGKSGLVEAGPLHGYLERARAAGAWPESPGPLAKALVRDGLLTHYQAEQLLIGRYRNFFVAGKYKVLERLGAGGMGNVFLCEHRIMRRLVALKVLPAALASRPAALARFHREARAAAQLHHPNIVGAYDSDVHGKLHFMVMEYVEGSNLEEYVLEHGPMEYARAANYARQAALGLQHAHEAGLVHRDIKPSNLLVDGAGTVKVLDLGLALFFEDEADNLTNNQDNQAMLGTLDYLAPEQALDSHGVDIRADIYSLGATLYHLLTGRSLFPDGTMAQKLSWQQNHQPVPVRALRPDLPAELGAVVDRMLAKDRARRYQAPSEVVEALGPWASEPVAPPPLPKSLRRLSPAARGVVQKQATPRTPAPGRLAPPSPAVDARARARAQARAAFAAAGRGARAVAGRARGAWERRGGRPWGRVAAALPLVVLLGALLRSSAGRTTLDVVPISGGPLGTLALLRLDAAEVPRAGAAAPEVGPSTRTNSVGMTLVLVTPGEFLMGAPDGDPDAADAERPRHRVRISRPFYLGAHEVTVGQFRAFVEATGYRTDAESSGLGGSVWDAGEGRMVRSKEATWRSPGVPSAEDSPVVQVSWEDAGAFCRWLSLKERRAYRLPTEAEWEYACRAGTTTRWSTGDRADSVAAASWHDETSGLRPHPVGRKAPNRLGLHDMHGNAREWCLDRFGPYAGGDAIDPAGPAAGAGRVVRGGSWDWGIQRTRSSYREGAAPDDRAFSHGFRVCQPSPREAAG